MPIVNLLDSYKVYHKVDPPPSVEESREIGFSCHVFSSLFATDRSSWYSCTHSSWYSCAHTHTSCVPFMHSSASPLTTLPLSPSVVGLLSQMSTFHPFLLATSKYFGFYFQCFPVFVCLFVSPAPKILP